MYKGHFLEAHWAERGVAENVMSMAFICSSEHWMYEKNKITFPLISQL